MCSQIVLKCLYLARIGRPENLWSVNRLAGACTKWTRACGKRSVRLISCVHHTCAFKLYCHVGNTAQQCELGLFKDSDFARDLEDLKSTSGGISCIYWMCKKQTSVSHSSTEAEIIALDAGLRMVSQLWIFWNLVAEVIHSSQDHSSKTKGLSVQGNLLPNTSSNKRTRNQTKVPTKHNNLGLCHVDNEAFGR